MTSSFNEKIQKVKTALENVFEKKSNKVTSWSSTTTNTNYPSEKLVKDSLNSKASSNHEHSQYINNTSTFGVPIINDYGNTVDFLGRLVYDFDEDRIYYNDYELANIDDISYAVEDYAQPKGNYLTSHQDISGKEDTSNKSLNITTDTGSTTKYPTVKAVEDYAQPKGNYLTSHQSLDSKTVTIEKQSTAETGYIATYVLKQGGSALSPKINIPKDYLVKKAELKTCSTANSPTQGLSVGDKFIDFTINSKDSDATSGNQHLYINLKDLMDTYEADDTTLELNDGVFSVKSDVFADKSHGHGKISSGGTISETTSSVNNVMVTDTTNNNIRVINKLPFANLNISKANITGLGITSPTKTSDLTNDGADGTNVYVANNDSRLSNSRNPLFTSIVSGEGNVKYLNQYRTGGFYYCDSDANSKYIDNTPLEMENNRAFFLLVETWGASHNNYVKQTLTYYNNDKTYIRTKAGNSDANTGWRSWKEVTVDGHNQATTTITNDQKYNNIKSGESTTLTLTNQKLINDAINTKIGSLPTTDTTYSTVNANSNGLMISSDKVKLDKITFDSLDIASFPNNIKADNIINSLYLDDDLNAYIDVPNYYRSYIRNESLGDLKPSGRSSYPVPTFELVSNGLSVTSDSGQKEFVFPVVNPTSIELTSMGTTFQGFQVYDSDANMLFYGYSNNSSSDAYVGSTKIVNSTSVKHTTGARYKIEFGNNTLSFYKNGTLIGSGSLSNVLDGKEYYVGIYTNVNRNIILKDVIIK